MNLTNLSLSDLISVEQRFKDRFKNLEQLINLAYDTLLFEEANEFTLKADQTRQQLQLITEEIEDRINES